MDRLAIEAQSHDHIHDRGVFWWNSNHIDSDLQPSTPCLCMGEGVRESIIL